MNRCPRETYVYICRHGDDAVASLDIQFVGRSAAVVMLTTAESVLCILEMTLIKQELRNLRLIGTVEYSRQCDKGAAYNVRCNAARTVSSRITRQRPEFLCHRFIVFLL